MYALLMNTAFKQWICRFYLCFKLSSLMTSSSVNFILLFCKNKQKNNISQHHIDFWILPSCKLTVNPPQSIFLKYNINYVFKSTYFSSSLSLSHSQLDTYIHRPTFTSGFPDSSALLALSASVLQHPAASGSVLPGHRRKWRGVESYS